MNVREVQLIMEDIIIIIISIVLASFGQLFFKLGMNTFSPDSNFTLPELISIFTNLYILTGLIMYGLGIIFWFIALSRRDLSYVYPFVALTFILVLTLSKIFLGEGIGLQRSIGVLFIITGLFIVMRS